MHTDLLLLIKRGNLYGSYTTTKNSGLHNAVLILEQELTRAFKIKAEVEICVDGNEIDKFVTKYKPHYCILEAIWVTPAKVKELCKLHKNTIFITRVHSKIPFLSQEGNAIAWLKELNEPMNSYVSFNNEETHKDFARLGIDNLYLPNIYKKVKGVPSIADRIRDWDKHKDLKGNVDIACFGAIRPLKNQLIQAVAAVTYANKYGLHLDFHINGGRIEQRGESVLKNIRSLFKDSKHHLIEHGWLEPKEFNETLSHMDAAMQVSFTESFNIVTADAVYNKVPVVVGSDISWVTKASQADENSVLDIVATLTDVIKHSKRNTQANLIALDNYNKASIKEWKILF